MTNGRCVVTARAALTGEQLEQIAPARIEIVDGAITSISSASSDESDAIVVDAGDVTLIPGFIDAHVHIGFHRPHDVVSRGVTTVRDLGWPIDIAFDIARQSQERNFDGPTVHAVGPIITCPGGYPTRAGWAPEGTGLPVSTPAEARAAVNEVVERGAPQVKIALEPGAGPVLGDAELRAIVDAAHGSGKSVTSHTRGIDQLERALDAGVDELAHTLFTSRPIDERHVERMVASDMAVVPTLTIFHGLARRPAVETTRRFFKAGGTILYGTDLGNSGPQPGIDRREVRAMAAAGMTARDIILSATVVPRRRLGLGTIGSLEVGAGADIVGLGGDPTSVWQDLTDVRFVMRKGRQIV
ncbi:MAG: amidohydrolase family protein [Actinomycetota bacterium]